MFRLFLIYPRLIKYSFFLNYPRLSFWSVSPKRELAKITVLPNHCTLEVKKAVASHKIFWPIPVWLKADSNIAGKSLYSWWLSCVNTSWRISILCALNYPIHLFSMPLINALLFSINYVLLPRMIHLHAYKLQEVTDMLRIVNTMIYC